MKRTIRIVNLVLVLILLCVSVFAFVGCEDKDKKYEVIFRICYVSYRNNDYIMHFFIMTPDSREKVVELPYSPNGYFFYVDAFKFSEHPQNNEWIFNDGKKPVSQSYINKDGVFTIERLEYDPNGGIFKEKGNYIFRASMTEGKGYLDSRSLIFITIN